MKKIIIAVVVLCFVSSLSCIAQWQTNGVPVCDTSANGGIDPLPRIAEDGKGGAYICWRDIRNGGSYDVYAQHVDSTGKTTWQRNGIPIVIATYDQDFPRICPDGRGGAFIAWEDSRSGNYTYPFAQRVDENGNCLWQTNGVKAANFSGLFISIASDGKGGLLLGWNVNGGNFDDVAVQRLDSLGNRRWGDSGVQVTNRPGNVSSNDVAIISDGLGGGIVAWAEGGRVYTQRVDSSGTICWQQNGILLSDTTMSSGAVALSSDTKGGAIINWNNGDGTGNVQRVDHGGHLLWGMKGVSVVASGTGGAQRNNLDGKSGAFVGKGLNIHHLDSTGNKLWGNNGVPYYDTLGTTNSSQVFDDYQGVFNFTEAFKNGEGFFILVQWIDVHGTPHLGSRGAKMTPGLSTGSQMWPEAVADGRGSAIVCWEDLLRRGYSTVWIGRIDTQGNIVTGVKNESSLIPVHLSLEQNYPNPFNPETTISFSLTNRSFVQLIVYDLLGRKIKTLLEEECSAGRHALKFDSKGIGSGTYFYCLMANDKMISKKMMVLR